ncbi:DUF4383 domain-containing protein [Myxosarcina sp. GI1]|uniref:DUF4383 domain-containing protein n=1 Tax=Myxosarcina sp. GI1 TaxID=1541065 RepID=UPI00056C53AF|nr:DUF4383 domain-containing protein [Myxosarcina sp. GI1]
MQRNCALALGIIFLLLGITGFIPGLVALPPESLDAGGISLNADSFYAKGFGYLFAAFPINLMHNIVHLLVGALGIAAATTGNAKLYNRGFAIAYIGIALMGLIPLTKTTFGIMPIFGNNVWFNALSGVIAGYYGFLGRETTTTELNA